ncbi:MAG: hypothetical protein ACLFTE_06245, partial [Salinivenus sp.]
RYRGQLYVATGAGVSKLQEGERENIPVSSWTFEEQGRISLGRKVLPLEEGGVMAATSDGIYHQSKEGGWEFLFRRGTFALHDSRYGSEVYAGKGDGLTILRREDGVWEEREIDGFSEDIRSIGERAPGELWLSTQQGDIFQIRLSEDRTQVETVRRFGERQGLP